MSNRYEFPDEFAELPLRGVVTYQLPYSEYQPARIARYTNGPHADLLVTQNAFDPETGIVTERGRRLSNLAAFTLNKYGVMLPLGMDQFFDHEGAPEDVVGLDSLTGEGLWLSPLESSRRTMAARTIITPLGAGVLGHFRIQHENRTQVGGLLVSGSSGEHDTRAAIDPSKKISQHALRLVTSRIREERITPR